VRSSSFLKITSPRPARPERFRLIAFRRLCPNIRRLNVRGKKRGDEKTV
jgi:hypothetical protein